MKYTVIDNFQNSCKRSCNL